MDTLLQDVRYAFRSFRKSRGFTVTAALTLALGIGANVAIFSIVDTVVFRPLPYKNPERLVKICGNAAARPIDDVSLPDFLDIRRQNDVFEQVAADDGTGFTITYHDGSRESVNGALVTANWLPTLGVQPVLGRGFSAEEEQAGRDHVLILTHAYWQRRFGADPNVIGTTLTVDGDTFTVIGVLPANVLRYGADFLKPLVPGTYPQGRDHLDLDVFARLKANVTLAQSRTELGAISRRLRQAYPATNKEHIFTLVPLGKYYASIHGRAEQGLVLTLVAVGLVLLIACANVANLLHARTVARYREYVIRAAVGASRVRLVRQMVIESVLLFLIGGAFGVLLAQWTVDTVVAFAVSGGYVPDRMVVTVDGRVLVFGLLLSLFAGIASGLVPAFQASRVDLNDSLKASGPTVSNSFGRSYARRLLLVSELALSLVLLVGFGLMIRSFLRLEAVAGGIDPQNLLETSSDGGRSFGPAVAFWRAALDETRRDPGVLFAAVTSRPPVHHGRRQQITLEGRSAASGDEDRAGDILVSADYFRAMGIPLLKGRAFTEQDNASAPPVVIISQSLARRYFPDDNPLGRRLSVVEKSPMTCCSAAGAVEGVWRKIVGVAGDVRQGNVDEPLAMTVYRPYSQIVEHDMYLMVRTRSSADMTRLTAQLRPRLLAADPSKEWSDVRSMRQVIDHSESIQLRRFILIMIGSFAGVALLLAAVGTYAVMAFSVAERTREIGIRVALGATRPDVLRQVLGHTIRLSFTGLIVGAVMAHTMSRFISSLLFGISADDATTYVGVSVLLTIVALLATYVPARRATLVDPIVALRHE